MIFTYRQENLDSYFKEISTYSVLTKEEENALFLKVGDGKIAYAELKETLSPHLKIEDSRTLQKEDILSLNIFSDTETEKIISLYNRYKEGKKARETLIDHNLRLVVYLAKPFQNRGISFFDLIQEGNLGLMKAVDNYSLDYGGRFSTYATFLIKRYIRSAIDAYAHEVSFPKDVHKKIIEVNNSYEKLKQKMHREPTLNELSEILPYSQSEIQEYLNFGKPSLSIEELEMDSPGCLLDKENQNPYEYSDSVFFIEHLKEAISCLSDKEKDILFSSTGLFGHPKTTYEVLSKKYAISIERVRQIREQAKKKILNSKFAKEFKDLLS